MEFLIFDKDYLNSLNSNDLNDILDFLKKYKGIFLNADEVENLINYIEELIEIKKEEEKEMLEKEIHEENEKNKVTTEIKND